MDSASFALSAIRPIRAVMRLTASPVSCAARFCSSEAVANWWLVTVKARADSRSSFEPVRTSATASRILCCMRFMDAIRLASFPCAAATSNSTRLRRYTGQSLPHRRVLRPIAATAHG